jgi:hypothetical protein
VSTSQDLPGRKDPIDNADGSPKQTCGAFEESRQLLTQQAQGSTGRKRWKMSEKQQPVVPESSFHAPMLDSHCSRWSTAAEVGRDSDQEPDHDHTHQPNEEPCQLMKGPYHLMVLPSEDSRRREELWCMEIVASVGHPLTTRAGTCRL